MNGCYAMLLVLAICSTWADYDPFATGDGSARPTIREPAAPEAPVSPAMLAEQAKREQEAVAAALRRQWQRLYIILWHSVQRRLLMEHASDAIASLAPSPERDELWWQLAKLQAEDGFLVEAQASLAAMAASEWRTLGYRLLVGQWLQRGDESTALAVARASGDGLLLVRAQTGQALRQAGRHEPAQAQASLTEAREAMAKVNDPALRRAAQHAVWATQAALGELIPACRAVAALDDPAAEIKALLTIAQTLEEQNQVAQAIICLALARQRLTRVTEAAAHLTLALPLAEALVAVGEPAQAQALLHSLRPMPRLLELSPQRIILGRQLSQAMANAFDATGARELLMDAMEDLRHLADPAVTHAQAQMMALEAFRVCDYPSAFSLVALAAQALPETADIGDRCWQLAKLAEWCFIMGDLAGAARLAAQAEALAGTLSDARQRSWAQLAVVQARLAGGEDWDVSLYAGTLVDPYAHGLALVRQVPALRRESAWLTDFLGARRVLERAQKLAQRVPNPVEYLALLLAVARQQIASAYPVGVKVTVGLAHDLLRTHWQIAVPVESYQTLAHLTAAYDEPRLLPWLSRLNDPERLAHACLGAITGLHLPPRPPRE